MALLFVINPHSCAPGVPIWRIRYSGQLLYNLSLDIRLNEHEDDIHHVKRAVEIFYDSKIVLTLKYRIKLFERI